MKNKSSSIKDISYNEKTKTLVIKFVKTTGTYIFFDVPKEIYKSFINSDSLGKFFNKYIRNNFKYKKF